MLREEARSDLGVIKIHKNVIASITAIAAMEIDGVKKVAGNLAAGILGMLGNKGLAGVKVELNDKNEEVKVEVPLVIKYDYNVGEVAVKVQENVRAALEKMTSLYIKDINVSIQGVERGQE